MLTTKLPTYVPHTILALLALLLVMPAWARPPQAPPVKVARPPQAPAVSTAGNCACLEAGKQCECVPGASCGCTTTHHTSARAPQAPVDPYASGEKRRATDGGTDWTWDYYRGVYFREAPAAMEMSSAFLQPSSFPQQNFGGNFGGGFRWGGFRGGCVGGSCR